MTSNKQEAGIEFNGINYKAGRFNYLFMLIGDKWIKSEFGVKELIAEARKIKDKRLINEFTLCYNAKIKRDSK